MLLDTNNYKSGDGDREPAQDLQAKSNQDAVGPKSDPASTKAVNPSPNVSLPPRSSNPVNPRQGQSTGVKPRDFNNRSKQRNARLKVNSKASSNSNTKSLEDNVTLPADNVNSYEPGSQVQDSYQNKPLTDEDSYRSANSGASTNLDDNDSYQSVNPPRSPQPEDSGYGSANKENFSDPNFQDDYKKQQRGNLLDQAKRAAKRGRAVAQRTVPKKLGESLLGDKQAFMDSSPENRDRVKELAKERARNAIRKNIGDKIGNEAFKKGFQKGLSKGAGDLAKAGAKKATKAATEAAIKTGTKAGAQAATKGLQAAVTTAGAASGVETLGLGFIAAFLLNIAIDLGVSEAIDCVFALKDGDIKEAKFHAIKAYMSIAMFIWLLVGVVLSVSIAGVFIGWPLIIILTIYSAIGMAFPKIAFFQGLSRKWEWAILAVMNALMLVITALIIAGIAFGICTETYIASLVGWTGVAGSVVNYVDTNFGSGGYLAGLNEMCSAISTIK